MSKQLKSCYVLPVRDIIIFPGMVHPLYITAKSSVNSFFNAVNEKEDIVLLFQKANAAVNPKPKDMSSFGLSIKVLQIFRLPDSSIKILVEGYQRILVHNLHIIDDHYVGEFSVVDIPSLDVNLRINLLRSLNQAMENYANVAELNRDFLSTLKAISDPSMYADLLTGYLNISFVEKQEVFDCVKIEERVEKVLVYVHREIDWIKLDKQIQDKVRFQILQDQKNYFKRERLKAIQSELTEDGDNNDLDQLEQKIINLKAPDEIIDKLLSELAKLKMMPIISSDASSMRNYIDLALELPWDNRKKLNTSMNKAHKRLDQDHYGLSLVKERILETIAMQIHNKGKVKGQILCIVGPPGVGKTSLGRAIADSLGRSFVRISLGGVRDEADIRGHRRTYLGAMPGRIIKAMSKAKYSNPVILLDEIDKIGMDFRGDPASALLEVLDYEQNNAFYDHYLELDYDLSDVFFIATANTLDIPPALFDRLEIIRIPGYTDYEKVEIANNHIFPKLLKECSLSKKQCFLSSEIIYKIIREYTREAGVRDLERMLYKICRQFVKRLQSGEDIVSRLSIDTVRAYLGTRRFNDEELHQIPSLGIVNGLAWTAVGGEVLHIEALWYPGSGELSLTGSLGDVMKESIRAAWSYVKSEALKNDLTVDYFKSHDIHIHVPEGATPKDGPSAGVAIATAMNSVVNRLLIDNKVAMTGEITLRGDILKIGGLKEKLIAAHRYSINKVFIPSANLVDLQDVPSKVCEELEIVPVKHISEVFSEIFVLV